MNGKLSPWAANVAWRYPAHAGVQACVVAARNARTVQAESEAEEALWRVAEAAAVGAQAARHGFSPAERAHLETWWLEHHVAQPFPQRARYDSRICFGIAYYTDEQTAEIMGRVSRQLGHCYNGGWQHGAPCGREPDRDYTDPETGIRYYAVTE